MSRNDPPIRRSRTSCSLFALATVLVVGASPAAAQSFQGTGTYVTNEVVEGITTTTTTTNIALNPGQTVIDWTPFDSTIGGGAIGFQYSGTTATFSSSGDFAVLNRINPADTSRVIAMDGTINGLVNGQPGGSIFFYSPSGFVLGHNSVINVGSLVLSASPLTLDGNGNFLNGTTATFGQAPNPNASITTAGVFNGNQSIINALNQGSYVAMVAPSVEHQGTINVNGAAAMVAAEAATINFSPDGLFDIQVTTGTDHINGVVLGGTIAGPGSSGAGDHHRVYAVAIAKNDALTLTIGNGAQLGFNVAQAANVSGNAVVLSAGHDIVDGAQAGVSAANQADANLAIGNATFTSALSGRADGDIGVQAGGTLSLPSQLVLQASGAISISNNVQAAGDITLVGGGDITGSALTAGGRIFAQAGDDIGLGALGAGDFIDLVAVGDLLVTNAIAGETLELDAGGNVQAGNLTAGDTIAIDAGGTVTAGNLSAGIVDPSTAGDAEYTIGIIAGGAITTGHLTAAQDIALATPGAVTGLDVDAGGKFMTLANGNMSFSDVVAGEVYLAGFVTGSGGGSLSGTCVGNCGILGPNGVVTAPPGGTSYSYVSTSGGANGGGQLPGEGGTNGSTYTTTPFQAEAGDDLNFWFNYVTSDGSGFADYAWATLLTVGLDPVAILFTARTQPSGTIVPGQNLPGVEATLNPESVPIIGGAPGWDPLGGSSGACYSAGCGFTGWVNSTYTIAEAGTYVLSFGVSNWSDTGYDSGLAFSGITVGGVPVETGARSLGSITIGHVDTGKFTAAAGTTLTTGIIDSTGLISLDAGGAITTDNLFTRGLVLASAASAFGDGITIQSHSSGPSVEIYSDTSVSTGNIESAEDVIIESGGFIETGDVDAAGFIDMTADDHIETLDLTAGSEVDLDAGAWIAFGNVDAGTELEFDAGGDLDGLNVVAGTTIEGDAGGNIDLGNLTAGFGEGEPDDDTFSVGITAQGNIDVGNVQGVERVGFATLGDLTTGSIQTGWDFMALVAGDISTGAITTGAGDQVYLAHASMCETGGGCNAEGDTDFDPELVLAVDPVATGGSIIINGPVITGEFNAAAGTSFVSNAITAQSIDASAGGTAAINGIWTAQDVTLASNDINITTNGRINGAAAGEVTLLSSNEDGMLIGDGVSGDGYALSNAEFGRISGGSITIAGGGFPGAAANTLVGDLTVTAGATGNIRSADGGLAIVTLAESGEGLDGTLRVVGDVMATGFGAENYLAFATEHFELDAATGTVALTSSNNALSGSLEIYAETIHVAEGAILDQLAENPQFAGYQEALNNPASVQRPEGVMRAATLWIESENLQSILIQNTGTQEVPAGFLVNEVFVNEDFETVGEPGSVDLVVNGQLQTQNGTLTGAAARDALVEGEDVSAFTPTSTINGCPLSGSCAQEPPPVDPIDDFIDIIGGDPLGDDGFGNDDEIGGEEGEGSDSPISAPQPLFDTRPLVPSGDVDDPVSGAGNPALLGGTEEECETDDNGQCKAANPATPAGQGGGR